MLEKHDTRDVYKTTESNRMDPCQCFRFDFCDCIFISLIGAVVNLFVTVVF